MLSTADAWLHLEIIILFCFHQLLHGDKHLAV